MFLGSAINERNRLHATTKDLPRDDGVSNNDSRVNNATDYATVEGYVLSKRKIGSSLAFLDVWLPSEQQKNHTSGKLVAEHEPIVQQVLLKRQEYMSGHEHNNSSSYFDGYMQGLAPGVRVEIEGIRSSSSSPFNRSTGNTTNSMDESSTGSPTMMKLLRARRIAVVGLPRNPQHVGILLQAVYQGRLPMKELATASAYTVHDLETAIGNATESTNAGSKSNTTAISTKIRSRLYSLAKEILETIRVPLDYPTEQLSGLYTRGEYILAVPDKELQHPPLDVLEQRDGDDLLEDALGHPRNIAIGELLQNSQRVSTSTETETSMNITCTKTQHFSFVGWVKKRRRFLENITVLELSDHHTIPWNGDLPSTIDNQLLLECVLHPTMLNRSRKTKTTNLPVAEPTDCAMLGSLFAPGSRVIFQGYFVVSNQVHPLGVFWVSSVRLLRASWRPSIVQFLVELVYKGEFDRGEAAIALGQTKEEMGNILACTDLTARQWMASEMSVKLQDAQTRMASISAESLNILSTFSNSRNQYPLQEVPANIVLADSDSLRSGSRWKRKKEPQLEWMSRQIKEVVESHPCFGQRPLHILDVGGGKGYLANHVASLLGDAVKIHVIDVAAGAVKNGAMTSKRLRLPVQYTVADASAVRLDTGTIDIVVALHACGVLTDVALGHAVRNQADFVICPCCFRSNPHLLVPHGFGHFNTGLSVDDWLDVDSSQLRTLQLLAEVQGDMGLAKQAIHTICALRACAVQRHCRVNVDISIRAFPAAFSNRNICLVGRYDRSVA